MNKALGVQQRPDRPRGAGDLLVRGGLVFDGLGGDGRRADVRIRQGVVSDIGPELAAAADVPVVDATGCIVAPGFVDVHTHVDAALFWSPSLDPLPLHGVTSAVMGNCSLSLSPIRPEARKDLLRLFAHIEDLPPSLLEQQVPFTWETTRQYFDAVCARPTAVRLFSLVGHSMLRAFVLGAEAWHRPATAGERTAIDDLLREALDAGALGLSSSRFDRDQDGRMVPSGIADEAERRALVETLGRWNAHFQFIPEMSPPDRATAELRATARWCQTAGASASWNGLLDLRAMRTLADTLLDEMHAIHATGAPLWTQISPRPFDAAIHFDRTMAFMFMPAWNAVIQAGGEAKWSLLRSPSFRSTARQEWDAEPPPLFPTHDLDSLLIVDAGPEGRPFVGRTFQDLVDAEGRHPSDVLADWVLQNRLDGVLLARGVGNDDSERMRSMLAHPTAIVGSGDAAAHIQMMCGTGDTTRLLTHHVRERGDLALGEAIRWLTSRPADALGLHDVGRLTLGARGDVVVFKLEDLAWHAPEIVRDLPDGTRRYRRPAGGYAATIVGGIETQRDGALSGPLPAGLERMRR